MNKIKILLAILGLILIPIVANLIFLLTFPFLCLAGIVISNDAFYSAVKTLKDSLARFD